MPLQRRYIKEEGDIGNIFDSFKKIFQSSSGKDAGGWQGRVLSYKVHQRSKNKAIKTMSCQRSKSEPDLMSNITVTSLHQSEKENNVPGRQLVGNVSQLYPIIRSKSLSNCECDQLLADNCPTKAAKTLGLVQEPKEIKDRKFSDVRFCKSEIDISCSPSVKMKKFSIRSTKNIRYSDQNPAHVDAIDFPDKAAKTLGITTMKLPEKAAKRLGIPVKTTQCNTDFHKSTEEFLRKIGAFASTSNMAVNRHKHTEIQERLSAAKLQSETKTSVELDSVQTSELSGVATTQTSTTAVNFGNKQNNVKVSEECRETSRKRRNRTSPRQHLPHDQKYYNHCKDMQDKRIQANSVLSRFPTKYDCEVRNFLTVSYFNIKETPFENLKQPKQLNSTEDDNYRPESTFRSLDISQVQGYICKSPQFDRRKTLKKCESEGRIKM